MQGDVLISSEHATCSYEAQSIVSHAVSREFNHWHFSLPSYQSEPFIYSYQPFISILILLIVSICINRIVSKTNSMACDFYMLVRQGANNHGCQLSSKPQSPYQRRKPPRYHVKSEMLFEKYLIHRIWKKQVQATIPKSSIFIGVSIKHPFWVSPNLHLICVAKEERCISNAKPALPGDRSPDRRAPWKRSTVKNIGIIEFRFRMNKGSYNINNSHNSHNINLNSHCTMKAESCKIY